MSWSIAILMSVVFVATMMALERYLVWRTKQLQIRAHCRQLFFDYANRALSHDTLPEEARRTVVIATRAIDSTKTAYGILRMALSGELSIHDSEDGVEKANALSKAMSGVAADVRTDFYNAITSWVIAVTFNTALFGWILRRMVFHSVKRDPHQAEQVIHHFNDHGKNHHNGPIAA